MSSYQPLTDVDFWYERQVPIDKLNPATPPAWLRHVQSHLPEPGPIACIEIGVVPGRTLLYFATHYHYRCTGLDFSPRLPEVRQAFQTQGEPAEFIQEDFISWETAESYDLVYSCGFIEHFENVQAVVDKHWALVRPGGLMLLTVPCMTPVQRWARLLFFTPQRFRSTLAAHNFSIMSLKALLQTVQRCPGSRVLVASYTNEMDLWFTPKDEGLRSWSRPFIPIVLNLANLIRRTGRSSRWYSPNALVLAQKEEAP